MALTTSPIIGSFTTTEASDHFQTRTFVNNTGDITIQIYGTFVATIDLQRSNDGGSTWRDVVGESYTVETDINIAAKSPIFDYRLNCTHTSGTANFVIAQ